MKMNEIPLDSTGQPVLDDAQGVIAGIKASVNEGKKDPKRFDLRYDIGITGHAASPALDASYKDSQATRESYALPAYSKESNTAEVDSRVKDSSVKESPDGEAETVIQEPKPSEHSPQDSVANNQSAVESASVPPEGDALQKETERLESKVYYELKSLREAREAAGLAPNTMAEIDALPVGESVRKLKELRKVMRGPVGPANPPTLTDVVRGGETKPEMSVERSSSESLLLSSEEMAALGVAPEVIQDKIDVSRDVSPRNLESLNLDAIIPGDDRKSLEKITEKIAKAVPKKEKVHVLSLSSFAKAFGSTELAAKLVRGSITEEDVAWDFQKRASPIRAGLTIGAGAGVALAPLLGGVALSAPILIPVAGAVVIIYGGMKMLQAVSLRRKFKANFGKSIRQALKGKQ